MSLDNLIEAYGRLYHDVEMAYLSEDCISQKYRLREEKLEAAKQKIHQYIKDNYEARN